MVYFQLNSTLAVYLRDIHNIPPQGFGALHHIPHGIGCAIGQPAVIAIAAEITPDKVRKIGGLFGMDLPADLPSVELGEKVGQKVREFGKQ